MLKIVLDSHLESFDHVEVVVFIQIVVGFHKLGNSGPINTTELIWSGAGLA